MDLPSTKELELLALVAASELPGREVAKRYWEATGHGISYGTLYTTLSRLKDAGWVQARDDRDQDGRIRYFRLTASGVRVLKEARREHRRLSVFGLQPGVVMP